MDQYVRQQRRVDADGCGRARHASVGGGRPAVGFRVVRERGVVFLKTVNVQLKETQRYDTQVISPEDAPIGAQKQVYSVLPKDSPLEHFQFGDSWENVVGICVGKVRVAEWGYGSLSTEKGIQTVLFITVPPGAQRGEPVQIWTDHGDSYCTLGKWWG